MSIFDLPEPRIFSRVTNFPKIFFLKRGGGTMGSWVLSLDL